jgi:hypothetical protein
MVSYCYEVCGREFSELAKIANLRFNTFFLPTLELKSEKGVTGKFPDATL